MVKDYKDFQVGHICRIPNPVSRIPQSGITLIEMIAVIVVVGLAIPAILLMWQDLSFRSGRAEVIAQASFYAQELMEEIKSKNFADPNQTPVFGPESGEGGRSNYDDVDDFNGYSDTSAGYTRCVTVDYVELSAGTWTGNCTPANPTDCNSPTCNPGDVTDYKRIRVLVSHQFGNASLVTIVSGY